MNIVTVIFTFNRSAHTKKVLDSIRQSNVLPQKLLVFHDGPKTDTNLDDWNEVENIINSIDWINTEIITSKTNKGLATSVYSGITYAFEQADAVIVLEDDCVIHPDYMEYMNNCLNFYADNNKIHSVSGYAWPLDIEKREGIYACGRVSSYGWGTWKDRWQSFALDYSVLKRIKFNESKSLYLAKWGNDLEGMLIANLKGQVDSWAVFWALNAIEHEMICLNPYYSMIANIGCDGSGIHTGKGSKISDSFVSGSIKIELPAKIQINDVIEEGFSNFLNYGISPRWYKKDPSKEDVYIYGCGKYFEDNINEILFKYNICGLIDNRKKGCLNGLKYRKSSELNMQDKTTILLVMKNKATKNMVREELKFYEGKVVEFL